MRQRSSSSIKPASGFRDPLQARQIVPVLLVRKQRADTALNPPRAIFHINIQNIALLTRDRHDRYPSDRDRQRHINSKPSLAELLAACKDQKALADIAWSTQLIGSYVVAMISVVLVRRNLMRGLRGPAPGIALPVRTGTTSSIFHLVLLP
jgi:hypothetical protein